MENQKTTLLIIEKLNGVLPTGEVFNISDQNVKLIFGEDGTEYTSIPVWVMKEAISDYFANQLKCKTYASIISC